jgi:fructoselysine and glucoselysine-specific PTS system IIC component
MIQALLLGILAFCTQVTEYALGRGFVSQPLVTGLMTGIIMGDIKAGIIMGATLELAFMGAISIGAVIPPELITGGILGVALSISSGAGPETALLLALPIATLALILKNIYLGFVIPVFNKKADKYAEQADAKGVERMHLFAGFGLAIMLGLIVTFSYYLGSNTIKNILSMIPSFIQTGLTVATGILPALGFAMLARLLINKEVIPYFFLGFAIAAYLKVPITGIAVFGTITAIIIVKLTQARKISAQEQMTVEGGTVDDDF